MDHHDDHNDRDDVGGDLYSEDGDNGLRSSLNLAGLSMSSSLQSDFQVPRTDDPGSIGDELSQIGGDDEERDGEGLEEDRDSEGRLRRSMILSKLSDDEDGDGEKAQDAVLTSNGRTHSEHFNHGSEDDHGSRDEEADDNEEPNGDELGNVVRSDRDDLLAAESKPEQLATGITREDGDLRKSSRVSAHAEEMVADTQPISKQEHSQDVAAVVEPSQVPQIAVEPTQPHTKRSEGEGGDAAEVDSKRYVQVQPISRSSPAEKPVDCTQERNEIQKQHSASGAARVEVRTQPCSSPSPAQVRTEVEDTSRASEQAPPAPVVVDCSDSVAVLPLPSEPHPTPSYKIRDLFPVVYEKSTNLSKAQQSPLTTARSSKVKVEQRRSPSRLVTSVSLVSKSITSATKEQATARQASQQRIRSLHKQLEVAQGQLKNATQSIRMHQVADAEKKQLQQRNTRLKQQLDALTAELQRTKGENAKLQAENELFAAKLPHLQAELLHESSQADEKQAQAVQLQLTVTQLKARVHVLQTRNGNLETQHEKVQLELRECRKELRRKNSTLQATTEKLTKLEDDVSNLKNVHAQELQQLKARLSTATQRFELEKAKQASELNRKAEHQLNEAKTQAASAIKRKRELEVLLVKLEDELKGSKREIDLSKQELHKQVKETLSLENLLKKAHRAEATLRNEVAVLKTKLRMSGEEQKKQGIQQARTVVQGGRISIAPNPSRLHGDKLMYPLDLLLLEVGLDSDDDGDERRGDAEQRGLVVGHCECCGLLVNSSRPPSSRQQHDFDGEYAVSRSSLQLNKHERIVLPCKDCAVVRVQLQHANAEIHRLRFMHADELKVQASAYSHLLRLGSSSRGAATSGSSEMNHSRARQGLSSGASTSTSA